MPFQIIRADITKIKADVIVNTANPRPQIGRGTDSAIYAAAGAELLLSEREKIGDIAPGQAACTPAFALQARYIIHTVGPVWLGGNAGERETLRSCYANSLALAAELQAESIAFPLISSGVYGFPKDEALHIALEEMDRFLQEHEMHVILAVFDQRAFELSSQLVGEIDAFIDDIQAETILDAEYDAFYWKDDAARSGRTAAGRTEEKDDFPAADGVCDLSLPPAALPEKKELPDGAPASVPPMYAAMAESLDDMLSHVGETFQQKLFQLIDASGMDDVTVYKKANIDRKVFSRIRCKEDYKPKKKTAVAFAIALQLDLPEMMDLLSRAEIAFSPSNKFDLIITYFVTHRIYNIFEINAALFKYGQPILGE